MLIKDGGNLLMTMILTNEKACYTCRICELACSFHHEGVFRPESSSIKVSRNNQNGRIGLSIDSTCDLCQGEAQPLCIRYCAYGALTEGK